MAIEVYPYAPEHEALIEAFNRRLAAGGSDWAFYEKCTPRWLPQGACPNVHRDYFVAVEDAGDARAGYCLKFETFLLRGEPIQMASLQGPVSEGLVDPAYGMLAFRLFRDMEDRCARIFAWGASHRVLELMLRLKWRRFRMPLQLRVVRAGLFLRQANLLRRSAKMRLVLDFLSATGVGAVGLALAQFGLQLSARWPPKAGIASEEVDVFGDWADDVWRSAQVDYQLIARRDAATLNALLPSGGWPHATVLRVNQGSFPVGWAAVRQTTFAGDPRFGTQTVGLVVDALAKPGFEAAVLNEATRHLERGGVDVIVSNFTHPAWVRAFRAAGFFSIPDRRPLVLAPGFMEAIGEDEVVTSGMHLTPLDGDGPLGF